jgi:hypothetical protein
MFYSSSKTLLMVTSTSVVSSFLPERKRDSKLLCSAKTFLTLLFVTLILSLNSLAQGYSTIDFHQAQNDKNGAKNYQIEWLNGILNATHTDYYEGLSVPQRIIVTGILPNAANTNPNVHSLRFKILSEKGGKHTYDFPTSWQQAVAAAVAIGGGATNELSDLFAAECDAAFSAQALAACGPLKNAVDANKAIVTFPDDIGDPTPDGVFGNVDAKIDCYEAQFGDRTLEIFGTAAITNASINFLGYSGSGKDYAEYRLVWTSSSDKVLIRFAAHLAVGAADCIGYGAGLGAGTVNGGSFHVILMQWDDVQDADATVESGVSIGNQDNQIMSNAIQIPPQCSINVPAPVCVGATATFSTSVTGTYAWGIIPGTTGASITGSTTGSSITVNTGTVAGTFTVTLTVTGAGGTTSCSAAYTTNPNPTVSVNSASRCPDDAAATITATPSPAGTYTYAWQVPSGASDPGNVQSFSATVAGTYTVTVTSNGCSGTGSGTLTVFAEPAAPFVQYLAPPCDATTFTITVGSGGNPVILGATYTVKDACGNLLDQHTATADDVTAGLIAFSGIAAGSGYQVTVTNSDGCTSDAETCGTCPEAPETTKAVKPVQETQKTQQERVHDINARILGKARVLAAPNPFTDKVRFTLQSDVSGQGSLEIYNTMGQKIHTVYQGHVEAGQTLVKEYNVPLSQRQSLIYIFKVGDQKTTGKLLNW